MAARRRSQPEERGGAWLRTFLRDLLLWLVPTALVWLLLTPFYNIFLNQAAENLVRLGERPDVTHLEAKGEHTVMIRRTDARVPGRLPYAVRTTDVHFHLLLLVPLFLAVPGVPWRQRLGNLGTALVVAAAFHVLDLVFWVQFVYATQLGEWSMTHYGAFARNFWGLGKHLLDLPIKLALPFALWAGFYLSRLRD